MTACSDQEKKKAIMSRINIYSLLTVFFLFFTCCSSDQQISNLKTVHDFRLETLKHERFYLNEHNDKTVLLVFWATWCLPCKAELTALKSAYRDFPADKFSLVAICIDPENINEVKQIVSTLGIDYPVLLDENSKLYKELGLELTPATILIEPGGRIAFNQGGYDRQTQKQLMSKIQMLLDGAG